MRPQHVRRGGVRLTFGGAGTVALLSALAATGAQAQPPAQVPARALERDVRVLAYTFTTSERDVTDATALPGRSDVRFAAFDRSAFGGSTIDVPITDRWVMSWQPNPCQQEDASLARLVRFPEGLALLRMRSDLDAASRLQSVRLARVRSTPDGSLAAVRRDVDSLVAVMQVVASTEPDRPEAERSFVNARISVNRRVRELASAVDSVVGMEARRAQSLNSVAPMGYVGVSLSSVPVRWALQSGYVVSYCEYPLVESVDPGSPAERSGLRAGDTLLAFNGQDVRTGMVDYPSLLVPDRPVRMTARRGGRSMDFVARVERRPEPTNVRIYARVDRTPDAGGGGVVSSSSSAGEWRTLTGTVSDARLRRSTDSTVRVTRDADSLARVFGLRGTAVASVPRATTLSSSRNSFSFESGMPMLLTGDGELVAFSGDSLHVILRSRNDVADAQRVASSNPLARAVDIAASPAPAPFSVRVNTSSEFMLFGARLQTLGTELRAALSLPEGVLVLQVPRGSPGHDAGLRDGDIIRRANGQAVRSVDDVLQAFEASRGARALVLRVAQRDGPERQVTLRW